MLVFRQRLFGTLNLDTSPVLWHELSYLPLPFLGQHIERTAKQDPDLARRALDACSIAPGQQRTGRRTLARLQAKELEQIGREHRFRDLVEGDTLWLPPDANAEALVLNLREVGRYLMAAETSPIAAQQLAHLRRAKKLRDGLEVSFIEQGGGNAFNQRHILSAWRRTIESLELEAQAKVGATLPNPFLTEALEPDLGREVFRGREGVARQIEQLLAEPNRSASVALLAPRRCGKTSLLKMLPALLPDAVCVFFDVQGHPVDTIGGFFQALDEEIRNQARRDRGLALPALGEGTPFEAARRWIEALERSLGDRRLMICLDEFEILEHSFPGSSQDLRKLMGLFRSIIQHRRRVRLLVCGEAPFDELGAVWNDHFISVRELRFGHLDPATARELLENPTPDFPSGAIPPAVAERIVERTGGQPWLLQLYAQTLVEKLNDDDRRQAKLEDLEGVEEIVLEQIPYFFSNTWERAPEVARQALAALSRGETPEIGRKARRWLLRRALINEDDTLTIPVLGRFLVEADLAI